MSSSSLRILFAAAHFPVSVGRYLADGFKAAGHEVITVGPAFGRWIPWNGGMELAEEYVWTPDLALDRTKEHSIQEVLEQVGPVDLIVHGDSMFHLTGDSPVPNVIYMADCHVREYREREYDLLFGSHSWGFRHEDSNFRWLPCAYSETDHTCTNNGTRPIDVGFVGVMYPNRIEVIQALGSWGLNVQAMTGLVYKESNEFYNQCKIALCVSYNGDVPCRVFENMSQGCVVLADPQLDLEKLGLESGKQLLVFSNPDELSMAVAIALSDEGRKIAAAGRAWAVEHNWTNRAREIIRETFSE